MELNLRESTTRNLTDLTNFCECQILTCNMFFAPVLLQSFMLGLSSVLRSLLVVFLPFLGGIKIVSFTSVISSFVANHVVFNRGTARPRIMPGRPAKDSGPTGVTICSA